MSENLKVNANSSVLEHKRKHNLLVEDIPNQIEEKMEQGELMSGYSFNLASTTGYTFEGIYVGACKNGKKLTLVMAFNITRDEDNLTGNVDVGQFIVPEDVGSKLIPSQVGSYEYLSNQYVSIWLNAWTQKQQIFVFKKADNTHLNAYFDSSANTNLTKGNKYYCRVEITFLLSENLIQQGD